MKIIIEQHIPYLRGVLERYAEVQYLAPEDITPEAVRDADALVVRTRTRCDGALLDGSRVQFIATATIGFDHIDATYCAEHAIRWVSCPGCNAQGVCDYVESALSVCRQKGLLPEAATIGIVGVGHVGSRVKEMALRLGYRVLCFDPYRPDIPSVPLEELARESDVVTFHTPLTTKGDYPTFHMADDAFFRTLKEGAVLINAARGGVVDEEALLRSAHPAVIDCWEGEPQLRQALLDRAVLGTFHIAGYTREGKFNASQMALTALCQHFSLPPLTLANRPAPAPHLWDIASVSRSLKEHPERFEHLRKDYVLR